MLDIPRLQRIRLSRYPLAQRAAGHILRVNFGLLPGVKIELENAERIPQQPVIFAMNHTDRYNYFPFQVSMWRRFNRFTATWVKGKYYENALMAGFMEKTNQLPTVSRGYLITKDFVSTVGRRPTNDEYQTLSRWVNTAADGSSEAPRAPLDTLPDSLLNDNRNVLGYAFDSGKEDYASYINSTFRLMMKLFVALNEDALRCELDVLIFPQGTRSIRLLPSRIGISQLALHTRVPIVPVGCNGSDKVYPGGNPFARKGHIVYRIGAPIEHAEIAQFQPAEDFEPFSPDAESRHRTSFEGVAELVTRRIDGLLDERYQLAETSDSDAKQLADRFL